MHWTATVRRAHGKVVLCFLLSFLFTVTLGKDYEKCLNIPDPGVTRYPYHKNSPFTIKIDTSNRITHQLSSHVFRIFLHEVLGYSRVEVSYYDDYFNVLSTVDRLSESENVSIPLATINLEVWMPPDFDTIQVESTKSVEDCGNVASIGGRFGWFIPNDLIQPLKKYYDRWYDEISEVSWTIFKNAKIASYFEIENDDYTHLRANMSLTDKMRCGENCNDGLFIPDQCKSSPCATLLAPDFKTAQFVIEHIRELKIFVKVSFMGKNLETAVNTIKNKYLKSGSSKSLVILSWTPSLLISEEKNFISVTFKKCELLNTTRKEGVGCRYEMNRLVKFAWKDVRKLAKPVLDALRLYYFRENQYENLLEIYENNGDNEIAKAACEWMRNNENSWIEWEPQLEPKIFIGGIFPINNSPYAGQIIGLASVMATEAVNANPNLMKDYKLEIFISDGQCKADLVMKTFIDYVINEHFQNLIGVLGPACSETVEPLASVSKHYETMIISYSAEGSSFSDRNKYPYFFRTIGENRNYNHVYVKFLQYMGWKQVSALTEDGQKYTEYLSQMQSLLKTNQISFSNVKFPRERDPDGITIKNYLEGLKQNARIIIADVVNEVARLIMCEAYKLKMTAREGYIWFVPSSYNNIQNDKINCTPEEMAIASNGMFSMTHAYYAEDDAIMQENITVKEWKEKLRKRAGKVDNYAGYAYDAVWTYALAIDKLAKTDPEALSHIHSNATIMKLVEIINQTDFYGVSGRIKFRGGPSRFSVINIIEWYDNDTHIVGQFYPHLNDDRPEILGGNLTINASALRWFTPDGEKPKDGSLPPETCALDGIAKFFNVDCSMAIVILNFMVISTFILLVGLIIYKIKKRYDKKVQDTENYMKSLGLEWFNGKGLAELDKWEIPREAVVINRKLGEGAFGTVYGGEAQFEEGWLPVAVKTLKLGSKPEEKVDFLSEANIMRRFNHANIVKLLGVVIKQEPLFTVMEFMLYGDLKTYLLARRHLAYSKTSDEVTSERLTSMALDVARGLSYLAESKYVHRDIASRNCLVNAQRSVKIGDFGMTRHEDYIFNRKGMLPVRWMAPESLSLGVYTPASDIWSYGVLLYEIVTFGSFPFQGLSNTQVLEIVKEGNCLKVPKEVKPQLEGLLKSCWNRNPKERPQGKEIVAFIGQYKELLTPCLDMPLASVQMEDSDELQVHFPDRKCSTPTSKNLPSLLNGTVASSHNATELNPSNLRARRQISVPETTVNIPLESYCPKEPLLGIQKSTQSLNNFGKYSNKQHISNDSGVQEDDDYIPASFLSAQKIGK